MLNNTTPNRGRKVGGSTVSGLGLWAQVFETVKVVSLGVIPQRYPILSYDTRTVGGVIVKTIKYRLGISRSKYRLGISRRGPMHLGVASLLIAGPAALGAGSGSDDGPGVAAGQQGSRGRRARSAQHRLSVSQTLGGSPSRHPPTPRARPRVGAGACPSQNFQNSSKNFSENFRAFSTLSEVLDFLFSHRQNDTYDG